MGWAVNDREHDAIATIAKQVWADAIDAEGGHRDGAGLAEITGLLPAKMLADYPPGMRVIVRRERPHPGAQLDLIETRGGWRYTAFATDTRVGQLAFLDARHRAHARVEDRIRAAKDTGLRNLPLHGFDQNRIWCQIVQLACELIAWTQMLGYLTHSARRGEPKRLRLRLLGVAGGLAHHARHLVLHLGAEHPGPTSCSPVAPRSPARRPNPADPLPGLNPSSAATVR